jgi:predicted aspartyl protease
VAETWLGRPGDAADVGPLPALLDTGADASLIPLQYLRRLRLKPVRQRWLRSQWGERRMVGIYHVELRVGDALHLPWVEVVGDELSEDTILGRNVLNQLRIFLDGPRSTLEIRD